MALWSEMPSGREEAIETLVDMDPQGNFFRAARVLVSYPAAFEYRNSSSYIVELGDCFESGYHSRSLIPSFLLLCIIAIL